MLNAGKKNKRIFAAIMAAMLILTGAALNAPSFMCISRGELTAYAETGPITPTIGNGLSVAGAYELSVPGHLEWLAEKVNAGDAAYNDKYYKMTADISLSEYGAANALFNGGKGWVPIGTFTEGDESEKNRSKGVSTAAAKRLQGFI